MQDAYVLIPSVNGAEVIFPAPISVFASSNIEAFEKFLSHPRLKNFDFGRNFQVFKLGNIQDGWCLVPLKEELSKYSSHDSNSISRETNLRHVEDKLIKDTLKICGGKKSRAARLLGISRRTIYRKLKDIDNT